ncbi:Uncharacterised protein [Legionella hackeliae]|uniref:hypothetical protein n=1 Tax=Legionella hackeliae TaxID=449 RepID=UPI000E162178|nr:hypothetical protein [Legionella hackeliae]STX47994.1 Uncharacterised protein [Legionella hackeliae]
MGYELPRYRDLHNKAIKLHNSFNELINRYIPPTYEQIRQKVNSLEEKYNEKVRKKSGFFVNTTPDLRRDQVACISQLLPKLPQEGTVQLLNNAQNILLGAVLYRYQRIILSYNSKFLFYLGYSADNSCVKLILEEEFEFEKQKLDAETIATCCEAYKAYLEQEDVSSDKKKKVADQFPYIQEDTEFFSKLKEIIVHARVKARPITIQLQVIVLCSQLQQHSGEWMKLL